MSLFRLVLICLGERTQPDSSYQANDAKPKAGTILALIRIRSCGPSLTIRPKLDEPTYTGYCDYHSAVKFYGDARAVSCARPSINRRGGRRRCECQGDCGAEAFGDRCDRLSLAGRFSGERQTGVRFITGIRAGVAPGDERSTTNSLEHAGEQIARCPHKRTRFFSGWRLLVATGGSAARRERLRAGID